MRFSVAVWPFQRMVECKLFIFWRKHVDFIPRTCSTFHVSYRHVLCSPPSIWNANSLLLAVERHAIVCELTEQYAMQLWRIEWSALVILLTSTYGAADFANKWRSEPLNWIFPTRPLNASTSIVDNRTLTFVWLRIVNVVDADSIYCSTTYFVWLFSFSFCPCVNLIQFISIDKRILFCTKTIEHESIAPTKFFEFIWRFSGVRVEYSLS